METFNYISVMISIVLGLGIANILNSIGIIIRNKKNVIHSSTYYIHCIFVTLLLFQTWWTVFGYKDYPDWDFFFYLLMLSMISLIYLMSEMLKLNEDRKPINLETIFLNNKTSYFLIFSLNIIIAAFVQSIGTNSSLFTRINIIRVTMLFISVLGAYSSNLKVQRLISFILLLIFIVTIIFYRLNLGELSQ